MINNLTVKQAVELIGGLSSPSKMPCHGYSIPATKCITGMKLRNVVGSICSKCYALKGRYGFDNVQNALMRRFESLSNPQWIEAMTISIKGKEKSGYFRWHDSGDIQSVEHLENIVAVCKGTPNVIHWLPTREYKIVGDYLKKNGAFPDNLTVRLSAYMIDGEPPKALSKRLGLVMSGVSKDGYNCPAPNQNNACNDCRACWNKNVEIINYKQH